ncbi:MAG: hypothetical protein AMS17_01460 [Spirochaetes bacterium DG_61]|jgi:hypothetical protein|nr:MAG: hypothetical protein AMS17_01460 [Spirochaetes bacterium DG_61]
MRKTFIGLLLLLSGNMLLAGGHEVLGENHVLREHKVPGEHKVPFSVGEKLRYAIYAKGWKVGFQYIELESLQEYDGVPVYLVRGLSKTTALLSIFYRLNDKWSIYMDSSSLLPLRVEKDWQEGKKEGYYVYDIDQGGKTVILQNMVSGKRKTINAKNSIFDLFSLTYYYRVNHAEFNDTYTFDFLESRSVSTVYFRNEGIKEIRIPEISVTQMFSVRKLKQIGDVGIEIYISNDHLSLPLKIIAPSELPKNKVLDIEFIIDTYEPGPGITDIPWVYRLL